MRNRFAKVMELMASENPEVCLLSGDIGNRMFDTFKQIAPKRFINCGIAEANMMSVASGMALCGLRPVVYTITPFLTVRCLEQIKIGAAYHNVPVVICGTGSGLSYAELGATHHSLEDIAVLRSIPGLNICVPSDASELECILKDALSLNSPTYIRIGKKGEPDLFHDNNNLGLSKANFLIKPKDLVIISSGPIVSEALESARYISSTFGRQVGVVNLGTVKPLDSAFLKSMVNSGCVNWVSLEEHYVSGGIGSILLEWLSDNNLTKDVFLKRIGINDHFIHQLGNQSYVRENNGIDTKSITNTILSLPCY